MSCAILETSPALVENGDIHCGFFKTPFRRVNLLDARNPGGPLGRPFRRFRLKEWVGFGINHPRVYGSVLIQNARYAASGTFYVYDKERKHMCDRTMIANPFRVHLPETLWGGSTRCLCRDGWITFEHDLENGRHRVKADIQKTANAPAIYADLVFHQDLKAVEPLVVSLPIPPKHHTYTHKSPLRIEGVVRIDAVECQFDPARDRGNLDEQKTFYPYRSQWLWGCFSGFSTQGREVMVNFVNQMTAKGAPDEDAMWVDGRIMLLGPVVFIREADARTFRIEDMAGRVRLRFREQGAKTERRHYGIIAMDYAQHFGPYDGVVVDDQGTEHIIRDQFGALEEMKARF